MKNSSSGTFLKNYYGEITLLIATLIWGFTFVIIKISLNDISNLLFVAIRFSLASLLLLPFVYKDIKTISLKQFKMGIILGIFLFLGFATQTVGLKYTLATRSAFITGSIVMFTPLFQVLIEKKYPGLGGITGSILVLIGLLLLSIKETSVLNFFNELGSNFNVGDFLTLLCAIFFAVQIVYLDMASREINFKALAFMQISTTAFLSLIFSFIFSVTGIEPISIKLSSSLLFGILYTAMLATIVTMLIQTKFQKNVGPTKAGIIYSFEPLFAAILAFFVLSEYLSKLSWVGGILIFAGLLVAEIYDRLRS